MSDFWEVPAVGRAEGVDQTSEAFTPVAYFEKTWEVLNFDG